jgi:hypothetical protein
MMRKWMFRGDTSREAHLYGTLHRADITSLKNLREFVAKLEAWPDNAKVSAESGMVLKASFWEPASPLTVASEGEA